MSYTPITFSRFLNTWSWGGFVESISIVLQEMDSKFPKPTVDPNFRVFLRGAVTLEVEREGIQAAIRNLAVSGSLDSFMSAEWNGSVGEECQTWEFTFDNKAVPSLRAELDEIKTPPNTANRLEITEFLRGLVRSEIIDYIGTANYFYGRPLVMYMEALAQEKVYARIDGADLCPSVTGLRQRIRAIDGLLHAPGLECGSTDQPLEIPRSKFSTWISDYERKASVGLFRGIVSRELAQLPNIH